MGLMDKLFGPYEGDPPGLFDFLRPAGSEADDDQTEIERAIAHNEARGDGDAIPDAWYRAADLGLPTFDEAEQQGTKEGWW